MKKSTFRALSLILTIVMLVGMLPLSLVASGETAASVATYDVGGTSSVTPGTSGIVNYFKEDTYYQMPSKINTPMTIEFELVGCGNIPGSVNGGVIVGNYSEDAGTYLNIEVVDYGKIVVKGKFSGKEWTASFYQSEADIRVNAARHYTVTIASGWTGVSLYVDGVHKATRYPADLVIPKASEYSHPFRIGGDYRNGNTNYFKGRIQSLAMFSDIRTASEVKADSAKTKTWGTGDGLVAAYDITRMGEAALRDYSGNGNTLNFVNESGIRVENFGKYEIDKQLTKGIDTFEAWIYMPKYYGSSIGGTIFGNYRSYNGAKIAFEIYKDGTPRMLYTNANGTTSYHRFTNVDTRVGEWLHIAITHDTASGEARCYINGELKQTLTENVLPFASNALDQKFLVGRDTTLRYAEGDGEYWENRRDQYFKGFIKEIRIYSDVRTESEIAMDYSGLVNITDKELVAYYVMSTENAYEGIRDYSGNGYDAEYKQLLWEKEYVEPIDNDFAYSLAIVGDTQTVNDQNPEYLQTIYKWIIANKDVKNIQYVIGLGDITELGVDEGHSNYDEATSNKQWQDAKDAITLLDGVLPYSLIRGDGHDGIEMFNKYFANHTGYTSNIAGYQTEGRIDNVYHTFTIGEVDYLLLCLDHGTNDAAIAWANEVVAAHPAHRVIVTTHQYIRSDGSLIKTGESGSATAYNPNNNNADELWNDFLSKHPNIFMVLCGHADADDVVVSTQVGDFGNVVTQVLVDPQTMDAEFAHGSKGMVAMLHFFEDGERVQVEYYSTVKDTYRPTTEFALSYGAQSMPAYDNIPEGYVIAKNNESGLYTFIKNDYFTFLGGSLRYIDAKDGYANIRFGYRFNTEFSLDDWYWDYGRAGQNLGYRTMGTNKTDDNVTNIVITGVGEKYFDTGLEVRLVFTTTIDGTSYTIYDRVRTRTILGVANAMILNPNEIPEAKKYAEDLVNSVKE